MKKLLVILLLFVFSFRACAEIDRTNTSDRAETLSGFQGTWVSDTYIQGKLVLQMKEYDNMYIEVEVSDCTVYLTSRYLRLDHSPISFTLDADTLKAENDGICYVISKIDDDNMKISLTRKDKPGFSYMLKRKELSFDDYAGVWKTISIDYNGTTLSPDSINRNFEIEIQKNLVYLTIEDLNIEHQPAIFYLVDNKLKDIDGIYEISMNYNGTIQLTLTNSYGIKVSYTMEKQRAESEEASLELFDYQDIVTSLTGKSDVYGNYLRVQIIVENKSSQNIRITIKEASIDDWQVSNYLDNSSVSSGKKRRILMYFDLNDAGINQFVDRIDCNVIFNVSNEDTWESLFEKNCAFNITRTEKDE